MPTYTELHDNEIELILIYRPIILLFAIIMGVYYFLLIGAHLIFLSGPIAAIMATLAGISSIVFIGFRFLILEKAMSMARFEVSVFIFSVLATANVTAHTYLAQDQAQFAYLMVLTFAVSLIGPTKRVVVSVLIMIFMSAVFLTVTGPSTEIVNNIFITITSLAGGFFGGSFLHDSIRAQCRAAIFANDLLHTVELEGARNRSLAEEANSANIAKAVFLANMSHELRTPLNGVVGIAHALIATDLTSRQRDMVDLIEKSGQTLTRLLSDILDFSKIEAGRIEIEQAPYDLHDEISSAAFLMQNRAREKGLEFDVTFSDAATGWFLGDATRIKQVVTNLVSNAIKFTESGGVKLAVDWSAEREILEIKITDTGVGFDAEAGQRLSQRFVQADSSITRRFGGSGLGLAICRGLVLAMGGELNWSSQPGLGSVFVARLPATSTDAPAEKQSTLSPNDDIENTHPLKILVAEDHETNQKVLSMILEPLGIELFICDNGAVALEAFKSQAFDLVLMDMQMPVMDGLAATTAIRDFERETKAQSTPIIMLTANAMSQHRLAAKQAGADWHVAKPFTPTTLIAAIKMGLELKDQEMEDRVSAQAEV